MYISYNITYIYILYVHYKYIYMYILEHYTSAFYNTIYTRDRPIGSAWTNNNHVRLYLSR